MTRKGLYPPMPDSLKGIALDVEFVSMLSLAQRASQTGGLERIVALVGNMVGVYPDAKYLIDDDAFVREFNTLLANPEKILRGPEEVAKLVQQAQQAAQAAARQQAVAQGAATANEGAQAAQTLSQTHAWRRSYSAFTINGSK